MHDDNDWVAQARCRTEGHPDMWHADTSGRKRETRLAKEVCRLCPVQIQCLTQALKQGEQFGIWAGFDMGQIYQRQKARQHLENLRQLGPTA